MNLFKKSFALFSFLFLFVLSLTFISADKAEAAIAVTVTANNVTNSLSVASGTSVRIDWDAPSATSCTNNFNSSTLTHDSYTYTASNNTSSPVSTTFTVNCSAPGYCSGNYVKSVDWNGNDFDWVVNTIYDGDGGGCGNCSQRGNLGYRTDGLNWVNPTCVGTGFIGCSGSRWSDNAATIRLAYADRSCNGFSSTECDETKQYGTYVGLARDVPRCRPSTLTSNDSCVVGTHFDSTCTWNP